MGRMDFRSELRLIMRNEKEQSKMEVFLGLQRLGIKFGIVKPTSPIVFGTQKWLYPWRVFAMLKARKNGQ